MNTLPPLRTVADALGGEVSGNRVLAPGPNHSRNDRSLSISPAPYMRDGFIVHSFANDDPLACKDYVREKLGLPAWRPNGNGFSHPIDNLQAKGARIQAEKATLNGGHEKGVAEAEYIYLDAEKLPFLRVVKFRNEITGEKTFRPYHLNGGAWVLGAPKGPKIPYRLPDILEAVHDTVFVVEGEKDADALAKHGFVATTNSGGVGGGWTADLNPYFAGKTVFVLADNDEPGVKHASKVAENLTGIASDVRIVQLPGLPPKGDVSDWLAAGGKTSGLVDLCKSFPLYEKSKPAGTSGRFTASELQHMTLPPIKYVVPGYVVEGLTLLAGRPKLGKSWLTMHAAIAVARGGFTLGQIKCVEGDVLYAALEDNKRRLQRRMRKLLGADAWPPRLSFVCDMPRLKNGGVEYVRKWLDSAKEPRLIVIDTLAKVRDPKGSQESSYESDYGAVSELKSLADEKGVAIVLVHHVRKMGADDPLDTVSGTTGLTGAVDTVLVLNRDGNGVTLYGRGRDIEEVEDAAAFDKAACLWRITGKAEDVHRSDERSTILAALREAAEALTTREITDLCGMNYEAGRKMLTRMVRSGEIERTGRGLFKMPPFAPLSQESQHPNAEENDQ
ncbi:MAG: hypothetical protein NVS2B5_05740 [Beijerinckiaceae bacterium]